MTRPTSLIMALAATASAAATTSSIASLFLPLVDPQPLVASIVGVDSEATTYVYSCAPGTDSDECGLTASETVTQGPTTAIQTYTAKPEDGGYYSQFMDCKLDSAADLATCTVEVSQSNSVTEMQSSTVASQSYLALVVSATVTAGFEKLNADAEATTASGAEPTASDEDGSSSITSGAEPTASGEDGSSSTSSPNAAPAVTQQALFAGVAALVGAIAL